MKNLLEKNHPLIGVLTPSLVNFVIIVSHTMYNTNFTNIDFISMFVNLLAISHLVFSKRYDMVKNRINRVMYKEYNSIASAILIVSGIVALRYVSILRILYFTYTLFLSVYINDTNNWKRNYNKYSEEIEIKEVA